MEVMDVKIAAAFLDERQRKLRSLRKTYDDERRIFQNKARWVDELIGFRKIIDSEYYGMQKDLHVSTILMRDYINLKSGVETEIIAYLDDNNLMI